MTAEPVEPITCELNRVFPCLEKKPQPAVALVRFEDCDCEEDHPAYRATFPICAVCIKWVRASEQSTCGSCGTIYSPGEEMLSEVVMFE